MNVWRAPDGTHWGIASRDATADTVTLCRAKYDQDTGQWSRVDDNREPRDGELRELTIAEFDATYNEIEPEPMRDPRITKLANLVTALLDDYEKTTSQPATTADEIRSALAAVAAIPEEHHRKLHGARVLARRIGFHHGRGSR